MIDESTHEPSEITYDEHLYPSRPRSLRPRARLRRDRREIESGNGTPTGDNEKYVSWLIDRSMLNDANSISRQFSGKGSMWQNPYATPDSKHAVETASVWFTAYPLSLITAPGQSYLAALGDENLWQTFRRIGIEAAHTGPVKIAGGLRGWELTPSVDGHFDRISTVIDSAFGTDDEFRQMCETAGAHGGTIIDDIIPGHTGKGPDFRLAEMGHADYPGIYHMVEIAVEDWGLLPDVPEGRDAVNVDVRAEELLESAGYIIGRLQRVIFYAEGVKETNWSATRPVLGTDGVTRRWVYLHYFKQGQPSINWLDPSFAGMRVVIGDALHSLSDLGTGALRLDANGFLGVEKAADGLPGWSEGHPLSEAANHLIASMVRKVGGFTFQELNLTIDDIKMTGEAGADLSYDFINRPAYHHALATADTEFLRLTLRTAAEHGVEAVSLIHALQNHDELTYELVHWATRHKDDIYEYRGKEISGAELAESVRGDLIEHLTGESAPYNLVFTTNGIACTTASVIAAVLGITDMAALDDDDIAQITDVHLLLAMFNAMQPGVFALSGWDLLGMLTLPREQVAPLLSDGDTRWIHRPAHDLMGVNADATASAEGLPRGVSLYGPLPEQLVNRHSFVSRLRSMLDVRARVGVAVARQVDIPAVSHEAMLVMVHAFDDRADLQVTVLNFSALQVEGTVHSDSLIAGASVTDLLTNEELTEVDGLLSFTVCLDPYQGRALLLRVPSDGPPADPAAE